VSNKHNLNKIAAEIAAEAYTKGWNEAISAIMAGVRQVGRKNTISQSEAATAPAKRRPRKGSDAMKVLEQIIKKPGLTGAGIVSALENAGTPVHERTVRTALHRLRGKFIEQREEAWYPIEL
jgi:transposase